MSLGAGLPLAGYWDESQLVCHAEGSSLTSWGLERWAQTEDSGAKAPLPESSQLESCELQLKDLPGSKAAGGQRPALQAVGLSVSGRHRWTGHPRDTGLLRGWKLMLRWLKLWARRRWVCLGLALITPALGTLNPVSPSSWSLPDKGAVNSLIRSGGLEAGSTQSHFTGLQSQRVTPPACGCDPGCWCSDLLRWVCPWLRRLGHQAAQQAQGSVQPLCGPPGFARVIPRWLQPLRVSHTTVIMSKDGGEGRGLLQKPPANAGHSPAPSQSLSKKPGPRGWVHLPWRHYTLNKSIRGKAGSGGQPASSVTKSSSDQLSRAPRERGRGEPQGERRSEPASGTNPNYEASKQDVWLCSQGGSPKPSAWSLEPGVGPWSGTLPAPHWFQRDWELLPVWQGQLLVSPCVKEDPDPQVNGLRGGHWGDEDVLTCLGFVNLLHSVDLCTRNSRGTTAACSHGQLCGCISRLRLLTSWFWFCKGTSPAPGALDRGQGMTSPALRRCCWSSTGSSEPTSSVPTGALGLTSPSWWPAPLVGKGGDSTWEMGEACMRSVVKVPGVLATQARGPWEHPPVAHRRGRRAITNTQGAQGRGSPHPRGPGALKCSGLSAARCGGRVRGPGSGVDCSFLGSSDVGSFFLGIQGGLITSSVSLEPDSRWCPWESQRETQGKSGEGAVGSSAPGSGHRPGACGPQGAPGSRSSGSVTLLAHPRSIPGRALGPSVTFLSHLVQAGLQDTPDAAPELKALWPPLGPGAALRRPRLRAHSTPGPPGGAAAFPRLTGRPRAERGGGLPAGPGQLGPWTLKFRAERRASGPQFRVCSVLPSDFPGSPGPPFPPCPHPPGSDPGPPNKPALATCSQARGGPGGWVGRGCLSWPSLRGKCPFKGGAAGAHGEQARPTEGLLTGSHSAEASACLSPRGALLSPLSDFQQPLESDHPENSVPRGLAMFLLFHRGLSSPQQELRAPSGPGWSVSVPPPPGTSCLDQTLRGLSLSTKDKTDQPGTLQGLRNSRLHLLVLSRRRLPVQALASPSEAACSYELVTQRAAGRVGSPDSCAEALNPGPWGGAGLGGGPLQLSEWVLIRRGHLDRETKVHAQRRATWGYSKKAASLSQGGRPQEEPNQQTPSSGTFSLQNRKNECLSFKPPAHPVLWQGPPQEGSVLCCRLRSRVLEIPRWVTHPRAWGWRGCVDPHRESSWDPGPHAPDSHSAPYRTQVTLAAGSPCLWSRRPQHRWPAPGSPAWRSSQEADLGVGPGHGGLSSSWGKTGRRKWAENKRQLARGGLGGSGWWDNCLLVYEISRGLGPRPWLCSPQALSEHHLGRLLSHWSQFPRGICVLLDLQPRNTTSKDAWPAVCMNEPRRARIQDVLDTGTVARRQEAALEHIVGKSDAGKRVPRFRLSPWDVPRRVWVLGFAQERIQVRATSVRQEKGQERGVGAGCSGQSESRRTLRRDTQKRAGVSEGEGVRKASRRGVANTSGLSSVTRLQVGSIQPPWGRGWESQGLGHARSLAFCGQPWGCRGA
ncbi:hypothetical protein Cadr_000029473 [Camelus dromedarius]|uniref:Uncharacterized protein n=1 Tax=Camelus dromedarius TaxID=9838 RepID=A0A5N4C5Y4_CAMDR|nr:hypothetical protein Cadr_000029473 [Camelus dromedarius]